MDFFTFSVFGMFIRFAELLGGPFQEPSMLWFALPLLASLIIIELNTGSSKRSFWKNTHEVKQAFPHAIVLFFVAMDLFRRTFEIKTGFVGTVFSGLFLGSLVVLLLSLFVFLYDYKLEFPRKTYLGLTFHLPINVLAYMIVVASYLRTGFDLSSIGAGALFALLMGVLIFLVKRVEPEQSNNKNSFNFYQSTASKNKQIFGDRESSYSNYPMPKKRNVQKKTAEEESDTVDITQSNLTWFKQ